MKFFVGVLVPSFVFAFAFNSHSSAAATDAHLSGTLTDPSGAGIADVHITAAPDPSSGASGFTTTSAPSGEFAIALPPGHYRVKFVREPFVTRELEVDLAAGEIRKADLRLELERLSSRVIVTAQAEPVESSTSPAPATIFTRQEIEQRGAVAIADLLLHAPAISIGRTGPEGGQTSVFLGGGNSSFTKVLVDGTTANEPGNAVDFSNFTLDNIDKVEIVRGAESALYGTDALVGVIQVFTHRGATRTPAVAVFGEGGSFSTGRGGAQISGLAGRFDYSGAASYFQTGGQGVNNAFLNRTLSGNFGWRFTGTNHLRLTLRNNTSDAGNPGQTLLLPPNLSAHTGLHNFSANLRWEFQSGAHWRHQIAGEELYVRNLFAFPPFFTSSSRSNRAGFRGQSSYVTLRAALTLGYQFESENGSPGGSPHVRRNNQGGFLDARWQPFTRLTLSAGGRAEANESFGTRVVPRVGAAFVAHSGKGFWGDTRLRAFYGQGIKEPRLDQSFGADRCFPGNPNLRPETSRSFDAGVDQKLASDRLRVSAGYFQNRFRDVISFGFVAAPPGCNFGAGTFFNTDLARARGAVAEVEARAFHWLTVAANYTYDNSRVLKSLNPFGDPSLIPGNRLLRRPLHSGSVVLNAGYSRFNINLAGYFSGERTDSDFLGFGLTRNPGYARFDLAASCDLGRGLAVYGRVTNLFDKTYQDALGYPALGRDFRLGMKYRFGGKE